MVNCRFNSYFTFITKENSTFSNMFPLLLISERGLSPESYLAIAIRALVAHKPVTYKKNKCKLNVKFLVINDKEFTKIFQNYYTK